MKKQESDFWQFSPGFIGLNLLISLGIVISFCPSCLFSLEGFSKMWDSLLLTFLMSVSLSYGGSVVEHYFDKRLSWIRFPVRRLLLETASYMLYAFCVSYLLIVFFLLVVRQSYSLDNMPWVRLLDETRLPMLLSLGISTLLISRSFLVEWRKAAIEAEQLKTERYARQYQSLKEQLNPHFLFNSFNVLTNLVYENPDTAARFIGQLSKIYRYVLDVQQEELVTLEQELEFARNYLALQKIRFEEGLNYQLPQGCPAGRFIPPLSLQLLLENAVKHNVASLAAPLSIDITVMGEELWVSNNLQLRTSFSDESTGVGLANICKRYELLSPEKVVIERSEQTFRVRLPLLEAGARLNTENLSGKE